MAKQKYLHKVNTILVDKFGDEDANSVEYALEGVDRVSKQYLSTTYRRTKSEYYVSTTSTSTTITTVT